MGRFDRWQPGLPTEADRTHAVWEELRNRVLPIPVANRERLPWPVPAALKCVTDSVGRGIRRHVCGCGVAESVADGSSRVVRTLRFAPLLVLAFLVGACSRGDPHAAPIGAADRGALAKWRMIAADRFTREEWREFEAALQELRLQVMAHREATGSEAIDDAVCRRIDGRTFREVLVLGCESKLERLEPVRNELKTALDTNALLVTQPGDREAQKHLEGFRQRQGERLAKLDAELSAAEERLAALGGRPAGRTARAQPRDVSTAPLPRVEAKAQITELIENQRAAAILKYGAWPVKFDYEGAELPESDRAEFQARRAGAAGLRHAVIAVRVRGRWWIYDAPVGSPGFTTVVTENLTDADRREIEMRWSTLQAEIWARRQASEQL